MGFFGKLKDNMHHGGLKLTMQVPDNLSSEQASIPVAITITASDEPQTINRIELDLMAESYDRSFSPNNGMNGFNNQNNQNEIRSVARSDNTEQFQLAAGESKTIQIAIVMNMGATLGSIAPDGSGTAAIANVLQKVEAVSEAMSTMGARYFLEAKAHVEGLTLSPTCKQNVTIHGLGGFGGSIGIHL